jgi:hypothetical protein
MTTTPRLLKSQTQVNTTDGGADQRDPGIVALADGGFLVTWEDDTDALVSAHYTVGIGD